MLDSERNGLGMSPTPENDVPSVPKSAIMGSRDVLEKRRQAAEGRKAEEALLKPYKRDLAARHMDGRTEPVDAVTLLPVVFERPVKPKRQRSKLLATASKFKGGRGRAALPAFVTAPEEVGQVEVSIDRMAAWRMDSDLERARRAVPVIWDQMAVDLWLQAAYETLFRMPVKIWPKSYGSCMPTPTDHREIDFADEVARAGNEDGNEVPPLFGMARLRTLGMPEKFEIERMGEALQWSMKFLLGQPMVADVVGHAAMWKALDVSFGGDAFRRLCKKKFGLRPVEFDRMRGAGLTIIAGGLNAGAQRPSG